MSPLVIAALLVFTVALVHAAVLGVWRDRISGTTGRSADRSSPAAVGITVVVPARDAAGTITLLLQDLHGQTFPKALYEVIVVDDASADDTFQRARALAERWSELRVLPAEGAGKKAAITTGVRAARHPWVLVTDADVRCGPDRLARFAARLETAQEDLIGGPVRMPDARGLLGRLQQQETAALQGATMGSGLGGRPILLNGANMAVRREVFERVGGYAGDRWASGDDVFLLERVLRQGGTAGWLPDATAAVDVAPEHDLPGWWRQRLRWAGKMRGSWSLGGMLAGLVVLLLPWALLLVSWRFVQAAQVGMGLLRTGPLLAAAWLLWVVPVLRLVGAVERTWGVSHRPLVSLLALLAFTVYAPLIAILSIFVRTTWKGRRV